MRERLGGDPGPDDEFAAACYVEDTPMFGKSKPVLRHVYVLFKEVETFRVVEPGETIFLALLRLEWGPWFKGSLKELAGEVLNTFLSGLADKMERHPFIPPSKQLVIPTAG